jgi:tRNA(Ile)-lysidine synthase
MDTSPSTLPARFAAIMDRLGPWEEAPTLAAGVSGGADSSALALLGQAWARARGGRLRAMIVDHGLRPAAATEARLTRDRLAARGIDARILVATGLHPGSALAERARIARYGLLRDACARDGLPHLLLGHHALDQAETVMTRVLGGSGPRGLAGMPVLSEGAGPRLLRPLLAESPAALRRFLHESGMTWVEDPSNANPAARRARLRQLHADRGGEGEGTRALLAATAAAGQWRATRDHELAAILAERARIHPEGFALLSHGPIDPEALSALLRVIGGAVYPPASTAVAALARDPRPATLAGVRVQPAQRLGPGWLLTREERSIAPATQAQRGRIWDGRFRVIDDPSPGLTIGALGPDAARLRDLSNLPAAVLRGLPAFRSGNLLAAVPHLFYRDPAIGQAPGVVFHPPGPLGGAPFAPI